MKNCIPLEFGNILATPFPPLCPSLPPPSPRPVCRARPRVYFPAVLSGPPSCRLFAVCFAMCFRETPRTDYAGSDTTSLPPLFFSRHSFYIIRDHYFSPSSLLSSVLIVLRSGVTQSAIGLSYCRLMHVQRGVGRLFLSNIWPEGKEGCAGVLERQGLKM